MKSYGTLLLASLALSLSSNNNYREPPMGFSAQWWREAYGKGRKKRH